MGKLRVTVADMEGETMSTNIVEAEEMSDEDLADELQSTLESEFTVHADEGITNADLGDDKGSAAA